MRRNRGLAIGILALLLISTGVEVVSPQPAANGTESSVPLPRWNLAPMVTVRAASGASIGFKRENGETRGDVVPQALDLPYLVLYRNGALTHADERTILVTVGDLVPPASGLTVTLTVQTYHGDPDLGGALEDRITVWRESKWLGNSSDLDGAGGAVVFEHEFGASFQSGTETAATPTDYYRYDLTVVDSGSLVSGAAYNFGQDYAFLMENQWSVPLNLAQRSFEGAVPDELVVYYCDMFAFQRDANDPASRLPRAEIPYYVQKELGPAMREAFQIQTEQWGFPWQQAWTSYRAEDGRERVSVALSDGQTWFHGEAPIRGHSGISIRTEDGTNRNHETLTDGFLSTFHHELFHNLQKGVVHAFGGHGDVDGQQDEWGFFSEGTAVLAESVAQPGTQFAQTVNPRTYFTHANGFIGRTNYHGELNSSYAAMTPYRAAIYWRFLYEQCGGMVNGTEDPAAGMRIVRRSLEVLYSGMEVDMRESTDLVQYLPAVMDHVLKDPEAASCPFQTFRESLQHFARTIYQLRLEGGRCTAPGVPAGCGFYDPNHLYFDPPVSTITYRAERTVFSAAEQPYPRGIESSFGIDYVDVVLDSGTQGQPLTIEVFGAPGGGAEFSVEIWKLMDAGIKAGSKTRIFPVANPEQAVERAGDGHLLYTMSEINPGEINRLGLIITRLDNEEDTDPVGDYTIVMQPSRGP